MTSWWEYILYAIYVMVGVFGVFCSVHPALWLYTLGAIFYTVWNVLAIIGNLNNDAWFDFFMALLFGLYECSVAAVLLWRMAKDRAANSSDTQSDTLITGAPSERTNFARTV